MSGDLTFHRRWSGNEEVLPTDFTWNGQPLVVLDPSNTQHLDRMRYLLIYSGWVPQKDADALDDIFREFAGVQPPKPDEPQGLGAVVEDAAGLLWIHRGNSWSSDSAKHWVRTDGPGFFQWDDISAVRVLSEGVS